MPKLGGCVAIYRPISPNEIVLTPVKAKTNDMRASSPLPNTISMNMNHYTNAELEDIRFIYGLANGNGRVADRLYGERHQTRLPPNHQTFTQVNQNRRNTNLSKLWLMELGNH
ncbi:hypothetical protein TNCV_3679581 [Trichonephila clavipes]|nr:hypothetical protein TNCV_3679581 [Trichonephila clavipes]